MIRRKPSIVELEELRAIASYQFRGYGNELIPDDVELVISPRTYKIRYLLFNGEIYLSLRASDYRLILHIPSGIVLNNTLPHPFLRVYVSSKYSGYIKKHGNVFTKHVVVADPDIKPGDEVLVVNVDNYDLIGVGRAIKPGWAMPLHNWGEAVRIRERVGESFDRSILLKGDE